MGVRGFTTYMSKHSHLFHETLELKNCYVIIDGSGVAINLYVWHTRSNDCFGGDYDNYANTVCKFFDLLKRCNITPIILFDGAYENRKLKTVYSRMRSRICSIGKLDSSRARGMNIFPLFTKEIFQDIALSQGIKCIRNDHESDSEIACLGRYMGCPIIGYDSDFYFFDTLYIPFDKFEMRAVSCYNKEYKKYEYHVPCQVYKIDKFLNYFGGLNKTNLPLLPVLLGNDYVKKSLFSAFYRHIKLKKSKTENEQQRLIKTVIIWLQNENLESAISKILGRFKRKKRRLISYKLHNAMKGYLQISSTITKYLEDMGVSISEKEEYKIDILNIKPTATEESDSDASDGDLLDVDSDSSEIEFSESNELNDIIELELHSQNPEKTLMSNEELYFIEKYRKCLLPQCFADIKWGNTYFCLPQVENYAYPNSHRISLDILSCIHKILNPSANKPFTCVLRSEDRGGIKKEIQEPYIGFLPTLTNIQQYSDKERKHYLMEILKIDETYQEFLNMFPSNWHIYLLSLYYWKQKSTKVIDTSYFHALLICAIVLNFVDSKIGFCRSAKALARKSKIQNLDAPESKTVVRTESVKDSFRNIGYNESLSCIQALLNFFSMQRKKPVNKRLNEASIVGYFSEFQSCVLHIKYLNALFSFPFDNLNFSQFFNGTFLYNAVVDFRRRSNLKSYIETLFKDCGNVVYSVQLIMRLIEQFFGEISESNAKKQKRKKKKQNKQETIRNDDF